MTDSSLCCSLSPLCVRNSTGSCSCYRHNLSNDRCTCLVYAVSPHNVLLRFGEYGRQHRSSIPKKSCDTTSTSSTACCCRLPVSMYYVCMQYIMYVAYDNNVNTASAASLAGGAIQKERVYCYYSHLTNTREPSHDDDVSQRQSMSHTHTESERVDSTRTPGNTMSWAAAQPVSEAMLAHAHLCLSCPRVVCLRVLPVRAAVWFLSQPNNPLSRPNPGRTIMLNG